MGKIHLIFNGKIHELSMIIFNSYVNVYQWIFITPVDDPFPILFANTKPAPPALFHILSAGAGEKGQGNEEHGRVASKVWQRRLEGPAMAL